jgi:hypothetical protein
MDALRAVADAIQVRIVEKHRHPVGRQLHVEFHVLDAEFDGGLECRQRVLGELCRVTAVSDDGRQVWVLRHVWARLVLWTDDIT